MFETSFSVLLVIVCINGLVYAFAAFLKFPLEGDSN